MFLRRRLRTKFHVPILFDCIRVCDSIPLSTTSFCIQTLSYPAISPFPNGIIHHETLHILILTYGKSLGLLFSVSPQFNLPVLFKDRDNLLVFVLFQNQSHRSFQLRRSYSKPKNILAKRRYGTVRYDDPS